MTPPPASSLSPARIAVIDAIRRGHHTVNALAQQLGVTDNAVRLQLSALERDGLLQRRGVLHSGRAGQPAAEYVLSDDGEHALSRAYRPVLATLVEALGRRLDVRALRSLFSDTGRKLAAKRQSDARGSLAARAAAGVALIESLGGSASVELGGGGGAGGGRGQVILQGAGCPLAAAVREEPSTCYIMESLLAEHAGVKARQRCVHGDKPCCRFELSMP